MKRICSGRPPEVALEIAHAASLRVLKSAVCSTWQQKARIRSRPPVSIHTAWRLLLQRQGEQATLVKLVKIQSCYVDSLFLFLYLQHVDDVWDELAVQHRLDLVHTARRDVGDGPAGLLLDRLFGVLEQARKAGDNLAVQDNLCLDIIARDNVADRSQSWRDNVGG